MSCIAGLLHNCHVFLAGESAATNNVSQQTIRKDPKVFRVGEEYLFGCTSSFRMIQVSF